MRTFEKFPEDKICPVCKTNDDKECVLIPIDGTDEGNNCEAEIFHVECLDLNKFRFKKEFDFVYLKFYMEYIVKKHILTLITIALIATSCSLPTDPKPKLANMYGEVCTGLMQTIKYSGRVELQYNGEISSSTLHNLHFDGPYCLYDFTFENIEIAGSKQATFIVKLMNGFGAETVYGDTTFVLRKGDSSFRLNIF